jgi:hypothetical protein
MRERREERCGGGQQVRGLLAQQEGKRALVQTDKGGGTVWLR